MGYMVDKPTFKLTVTNGLIWLWLQDSRAWYKKLWDTLRYYTLIWRNKGTWKHIAVTYDAEGEVRLYVDGWKEERVVWDT